MKLLLATTLILSAAVAAPAYARKDCAELKAEIAANIDAKGVKAYTLEITSAETADGAKVVGSCEGGTQRIVYQRQSPPTAALAGADPK